MLYKPLVLLHRLAPEEVELLIKQNSAPSNTNSQLQNVQKCQDRIQESNIQPVEKTVIANNSVLLLEKQQQSTLQVLSSNSSDTICNNNMDKKLRKHKIETSLNDYTNIFRKELLVVLDNSYNSVTIDTVNSSNTAQHPKTRNSKVVINCNNSSQSVQSSTVINEPIVDESVLMTTKSTFTEVIDKHKKEEVKLDNQMTENRLDKQTNHETLVHHNSAGLHLRTRTISSMVPTPLQKSTSSTISVHSNCHNSMVNVPRRRGRPPKNLTRIAKKKLLKTNIDKHSEKTKTTNSNAITKMDLASTDVDRLQQQLINKSTGLDDLNSELNKVPATDIVSINDDVGTDNTRLSLTSLQVDKNKECIMSSKKKNDIRKRKQSTDIEEFIAEKCILISNNSKDPLMSTNSESIQSISTEKQNVADNPIEYGFLLDRDIESYKKCTDLNVSASHPSSFYGNTYWPINWEYSASALISHVQKKTSKVTLRKIRLISDVKAPLLKTTPTLKKFQSSITPKRGSLSKLTLSSLVPVDTCNGVRHGPAPSTKRIGRPPGRKNKLLQAVIKSNCQRKSPRQHASTLAAIMSNKAIKTEVGTQQPDKLMDGEPKNSLDLDGPCILTAMPNYDRKPEVRLYRRRMHSDHQHGTIKSRRQCRSSTPTPPKLCAEQPFSRDPINGVTVDHEIVKLRTKHVDLIKRRACNERVRTNYIFQQLHKVHEIAGQNMHDLSLAVTQIGYEQNNCNAIILPSNNQNSIWSSLTMDGNQGPDNMCLQIMYEQTGDKRFLCTDLTDETLKMYHEQRDLILAERVTNTCGDYVFSDVGTDAILASNKRKKKRPNMTGWPKEKRRKIMAKTVDLNNDITVDILVKRQKAAEQQRLRRRRIKLEQQQLNKEKSKVSISPKATTKQHGQSSNKKNKVTAYRRSTNLNNTPKYIKKIKKKKKDKIQKEQEKPIPIQNKTVIAVPYSTFTTKKSCGRPKGSIGIRQKLKLELLHQKETPLLSEQQKENVSQPTTTSGEFKCVISTRNNSIKLLSSSNPPENVRRKKKLIKTKKSTAYNSSSSTLEALPSPVTVKRKRRKQESIATSTITWDVGRPKRYHHKNTSVAVEEEFCLIGSQPFEQHCPGVLLKHNNSTVLENNQDQKENAIHV